MIEIGVISQLHPLYFPQGPYFLYAVGSVNGGCRVICGIAARVQISRPNGKAIFDFSRGHDFPFAAYVVPHDVPVEVAAGSEEDTPLSRFRDAVGKANVFFGLGPTGNKKQVDCDFCTLAKQCLTHGCLFSQWIGRIEQIQFAAVEMGGRQAIGNQNDLAVGCILHTQHLSSKVEVHVGHW